VQIDMSTGKVLSTAPNYTSFIIRLHEGTYFGAWYNLIVVGASALALILLSFSGYYMIGFPLYKRLVGKSSRGNAVISRQRKRVS
jgi:uncharacterized iron-regulated membrane protein